MARLRYNGLSGTLGAAHNDSTTTLTLASKLTYEGGDVPTISGDYIPLSILDSDGNCAEIVHVTAYTSAATTGTITRGAEGTTAQTHSDASTFVSGPTAYDLEAFGEEVSEVEASWDGTGDPTPGIFYGLRTLAGINPLVLSGSEVFSVSLPWATASQSSNLSANLTAERATDLLIAENTGAAHTSSGAGQWWKVDFGPTASVTVDRLGLLGRDGGGSEPRNFKLQGSDDDSTWTDLLTVTGDGPTDGSGWWSSAVTGAAGYRYLRILQTGNNADSGTHLVIGELELWGTLASTAPFGRLPAPRTTRYSINHQTGTAYTLALSDDGGIVKCDNASSFSLTVPPESSVAFTAGANVKIKAHGAGAVTVVEGSGVTVNTAETLVLDGQYAGAELVYEGSDVWWLAGTLVAA